MRVGEPTRSDLVAVRTLLPCFVIFLGLMANQADGPPSGDGVHVGGVVAAGAQAPSVGLDVVRPRSWLLVARLATSRRGMVVLMA
jgi:hypothetical protein